MNNTSNTSDIYDYIFKEDPIGEIILRLLFFTLIFLQLLFPFYAYVNKVNRERDKNTLVFPIINHFYAMMKRTQVIYCFFYIIYFYVTLTKEDPNEQRNTKVIFSVNLFAILAGVICIWVVMTFNQVFQLILTILAVQKSLLYFYPSSQKYIILSRKNMQRFIRYLYYLIISMEVISGIIFVLSTMNIFSNDKINKLFESLKPFYQIFFVSINISFFASAFLYLPIMISVQKLSNLRSVQESKPQIYIFWQTMTVLVAKMIYLPIFFFTVFDNLAEIIFITRVWDTITIPVIIQISYLTCNRQNVVTLFSSFKGRKLIKELIKPELTTKVGPDPRRHRI